MDKIDKPNPFSSKVYGYWQSRNILFSKFDEGIETDEEGLYSVKAEEIALNIAKTLPGNIVLDGFCGIGGSAIAFARTGKQVIAVDLNKDRLEMARNNARLYGVEDRITFLHGDIIEHISVLKYDAIHFDPPWDGVDYIRKNKFSFSDFSPNGRLLMELARKKTRNIAFGVPRNFNFEELNEFGIDYEIQRDGIGGNLWSYTVYFR